MKYNPILNLDSYKMSHFAQYPKNTETVFSYIESRGGKYEKTLFFGLQMFLKEYLSRQITMKDVDVYKDPVGDSSKKSKKGRLTLEYSKASKKFRTAGPSIENFCVGGYEDALETVWEDGKLLRDQTFAEIRELSNM